MQLNRIGKFITFKRCLYTKTTINPKNINILQPDEFHKSLIIMTTPPQLNNTINKLYDNNIFNKFKLNQLLVVCVDSLLNSRNGYSEIWLKNNFNLKNFETIEQRNERIKKKYDPLSVDPIRFDKKWNDTKEQTLFEINFKNFNFNSKIRLANTLFENSENSTCFYVGNKPFDWFNLATIKIDIDLDEYKNIDNIEYFNRLTEIPLVENENGNDNDGNNLYTITDFEGNLIKSINNQSASQYLIDNSIVMESKKDLYFKLYNNENPTKPFQDEYYKLIVGGLGWGEKQAFLAIDPVVGKTGYRDVKLFYYDKSTPIHEIQIPDSSTSNNKIIFECSELENGYETYNNKHNNTKNQEIVNEVVKPGVFAMGCEQGFELDGVWHRSNGESVGIEIRK